jgi:hypothetical protein
MRRVVAQVDVFAAHIAPIESGCDHDQPDHVERTVQWEVERENHDTAAR